MTEAIAADLRRQEPHRHVELVIAPAVSATGGAVPIPGAKNAVQAEQNAGALGWRLAPEEVASLDRVAQRGVFNRVWQPG